MPLTRSLPCCAGFSLTSVLWPTALAAAVRSPHAVQPTLASVPLAALLAGGALLVLLFGGFALLLHRQFSKQTRHREQEIAERRRIEAALEESERNYRELVECTHAIMLRWDTNGRITFVNDFAESFFGYPRSELLGHALIGTLVPACDSAGTTLAALLADICARPLEYRLNENENMCKDGTRVWVLWHNRPCYAPDGQLHGILSVGLDITARKQAELARRLLERAKDDFIATAAHELRTPLTAIVGYAELLREDLEEDRFSLVEKSDFLDEICAKGLILTRIIEDLLDIGRIQHGNPLPLHLQQVAPQALIGRVVEQFRSLKRQHRFRLDFEDGLPARITCDAPRIEQVLTNLLSNATKYSHPGSEVRIEVTDGHGSLRIMVSDQGIGMTPEQLEQVFDKFYRVDSGDTAVGGLGIGMHIARQIVEAHGGRIQIESRTGIGTRVTVTLPVTGD